MTTRKQRENVLLVSLRQLILIGFSILALYPIYYMAVTAFKTIEPRQYSTLVSK